MMEFRRNISKNLIFGRPVPSLCPGIGCGSRKIIFLVDGRELIVTVVDTVIPMNISWCVLDTSILGMGSLNKCSGMKRFFNDTEKLKDIADTVVLFLERMESVENLS